MRIRPILAVRRATADTTCTGGCPPGRRRAPSRIPRGRRRAHRRARAGLAIAATAALAAAALTAAPAAASAAPAAASAAPAAASAAPAAVSAAPVDLAHAFDNVGITSAGAPAGNFDGIGDTFPAGGLAADGLTPGAPLLHDGLTLTWPDVAPGSPDNAVADGQQIAVTGSGSTLGIVGASAYGSATGTFAIGYTDGTQTSATVTLADWINTAPASGTDTLATVGGWNPGGTIPVHLSFAAITLDPAKTVASVTLPAVSPGVGKNVTAMHVFAMAIGTPLPAAAGAPGAASYYDLARKDCLGTAADTASKVWYTVAGGVLSDVYAPTIDNTNVKTLAPIITGPGFTHLQQRDMTYTVSSLGGTGMACRIVAVDHAEHLALVTDYLTDPTREAVVMQVSLVRLAGAPTGDVHVYLRFHPLLNGHGGGGTANAGGESATVVRTSRGAIPVGYSTNSFTQAVNRSYATPIYSALAAASPFGAVETGYAGTASDGLTELDSTGALGTSAQRADDGNVVQTVQLSFPRHTGHAPAASRRDLDAYTARAAGCPAGRGATAGEAPGASDATPAAIARAAATAAGVTNGVHAGDVSRTTVALGFGGTEKGALEAALGASATPFPATYSLYQRQWRDYDRGLCAAPSSLPGTAAAVSSRAARTYVLDANVLKASEDKTFPGATAASLASPWGQAVPAGVPGPNGLAPYFGSYREVFPRDAYETFTGFLVDGDLGTARGMVHYFFSHMQRPDGSFPRNGLLNGAAAPDTGGLQLDETADPILMAWQAGLAGDAALYRDHIKPAADFLVAHGPADGVERWEEQTGFSPSTIADEVAGLVAAAQIAATQGDPTSQRLFLATADNFRRVALTTTVTTNGPLSAKPYFIRLDKTGDPDQAATYTLGNGNPAPQDQRTVIDQGFLELVRQGEMPLANPTAAALLSNSLAVAAKTIDAPTPSGTGVLRYNGDGYGDCEVGTPPGDACGPTGAPWAATDTGTGHPWPVLSGENGEYDVAVGDHAGAAADLQFMQRSSSGIGLVPEQVWNYPDVPASAYGSDPETASIGLVDGQPDGSAAPLTWAQAQELRLIADLGAGRLLEQPRIVAARYTGTPPAVTPLTVSGPLPVAGGNVPQNLTRPAVTVDGGNITVAGVAAPGALVDIAVTGTAAGAAAPTTTVTSTTAGSHGSFTATVGAPPGTDAVEVAATAGTATNEAIFTVQNLLVPGTVVLHAGAAPGGGNGPGSYAYPTATNGDGTPTFAPGSFRLTGLSVIDSGTTVSFQVGIANLKPTFGSLLGAQLVDMYIHAPAASVPAGERQSTGAAGLWNYSISPGDAWQQLIQVDGFGTDDWVTPGSATAGIAGSSSVGTPQVDVAQLAAQAGGTTPGVVTITVPSAVLGHPGPGWSFTLTLTGQDGYGNSDARTFAATPQAYQFGVCSAAEAAQVPQPAICSLDPGSVPLVMDTIPPAGVDVQAELNPLDHVAGVQMSGVTVPAG